MIVKGFSSEKFLIVSFIWMCLGIGAVAYFLNYLSETSENMPEEVAKAASSLKGSLPIQYEEGIKLIDVSHEASTLIMVIEIDGKIDSELLEIFAEEPVEEDYQDICTSSDQMKRLLMFGAAIRVNYVSQNGRALSTIEANKETCEAFHLQT